MKYISVQFLKNLLADLKSFIYVAGDFFYWAGVWGENLPSMECRERLAVIYISPHPPPPHPIFLLSFLISVKLRPGDTRLNFSPRGISEMIGWSVSFL